MKLRLFSPINASQRSAADAKKSLLSSLAVVAVAGFVAVPLAGPSTMSASAWFTPGSAETANLVIVGSGLELEREAFEVTGAGGLQVAAGPPDSGSTQAFAFQEVVARGWDEAQYGCLVALWHKESGWNHLALNRSSGAYGIPQSLPAEKMASAGPDWATNPETQIRWGLGYIEGRYGQPCAAWAHSQQRNWY